MKEDIVADIAEHTTQPGDTWLLLSDGVFDTLDEATIVAIVTEHGANAGPALVEEGCGRSIDNLSAVVVAVT